MVNGKESSLTIHYPLSTIHFFNMAQVQEKIEINASPKACFDVITDYESYTEFCKETKDVKLGKKSGSSQEVTFTVELMKKVTYTLKMTGKSPSSIKWSFVDGDDIIKKNQGEWILEEVKKGVTKATYVVDIELGIPVPGLIQKKLISSSLPGMLKSFKKRIEESL
ncbi:SRPBCC family protein [bacterium]|nr:SRPBCC family protein [bacterium]